jgi:hypothetical protein
MGYWYTAPGGESLFLPVGASNPDGTQMRWGDAPSDEIDHGLHALIDRLRRELGRFPSIAEIDNQRTTAWEMRRALRDAIRAFRSDLGRPPTAGEIQAGLDFAATAIVLEGVVREDIEVGDVVNVDVPGCGAMAGPVEAIDLHEDDFGNLDVVVAVRTQDGCLRTLEPCSITSRDGVG